MDDWTPEPLVPELSPDLEAEVEKRVVLVGYGLFSSHSRYAFVRQ